MKLQKPPLQCQCEGNRNIAAFPVQVPTELDSTVDFYLLPLFFFT